MTSRCVTSTSWITRKGRPAAVVVSPEEWDAIEETLQVLQDEDTLAALGESEDDVQAGRLFGLDEVRRELGLAVKSQGVV
jgi:PHD/YefM family antitoxin component YafN of YafNO toxin-antitoxin module